MKLSIAVAVALACLMALVPQAHAEEADAPAGVMGILYATHTDTLALQTSYRIWSDDDWMACADVFWAPTVEAVGGGVSIAPPPDTPVIRDILRFTSADRIGVGLHYHDSWQGTVYIVKDIVGF